MDRSGYCAGGFVGNQVEIKERGFKAEIYIYCLCIGNKLCEKVGESSAKQNSGKIWG